MPQIGTIGYLSDGALVRDLKKLSILPFSEVIFKLPVNRESLPLNANRDSAASPQRFVIHKCYDLLPDIEKAPAGAV
jgi:hypothetical protein